VKYAQPGATFDTDADNFPTGLTGTIGVQLLNGDGTIHTARATAGISEAPAGSGHYVVALVAPDVADDYTIAWDDGTGGWAFDTLTVTYTPPGTSTSPNYITAADVKASLTLDGTSYADGDVDRAVASANAVVDQLFGRKFSLDPAASDRYYRVRRHHTTSLEIDDLTRATPVTVMFDANTDGTFEQTLTELTDYVLEPLNAEADGLPFETVRMLKNYLPAGPRAVKVNGTFGWPSVPPQVVAFAEVLAVKLVARFREAPFGIVTAGADMGVAMRLARTDPDFPTLAAGLTRGVLIS
jgi:hypothetical protein